MNSIFRPHGVYVSACRSMVVLLTTEYYYLRNGQGDVVKLIDASGVSVVEYTYDTWGKAVTTTGTLAGTLGLFQPFRYRGYVYDWETGFYYLQSRYYDPTTGRFISADVLLSTGQGVMGHNAYAYCLDNPIVMLDDEGCRARLIAVGVQLQISIGDYQIGVEVVYYFDSDVQENSASSWAVYAFAGISISASEILRNPSVAQVMGKLSKMSISGSSIEDELCTLYTDLCDSISLSLSIFAIIGNDSFQSTKDYCGTFKTISAKYKHVQGYYSWSDTCSVIGIGGTTSCSLFDFSFSVSDYIMLA